MLLKSFLLILGMILTIIGITTIVCFLNLLTLGYNFKQYIHFISKDAYCWCFPIGTLFLLLYLFLGGKK